MVIVGETIQEAVDLVPLKLPCGFGMKAMNTSPPRLKPGGGHNQGMSLLAIGAANALTAKL